jgi:hypothetical protein
MLPSRARKLSLALRAKRDFADCKPLPELQQARFAERVTPVGLPE